jgi:DNA-binding transcriptional MocR family regulator
MSLRRREQLVRLARQYDALIITDDVYDMLQWPSSPDVAPSSMKTAFLPRLVDIDRILDGGMIDKWGNCISNGSFSKIVGPGCRTGWCEASESLAYGVSQTGSTRSGGAPSQLAATLINDLIASGSLDNHIFHQLQPTYARRYHRLISAVNRYLVPLGVSMLKGDDAVAGGYFVWLTLPAPLTAEELLEKALAEEDVKIITGAKFRVEGDEENPQVRFDRDFRLCFAWQDEELLEEGVARLSNAVKRLQAAAE